MNCLKYNHRDCEVTRVLAIYLFNSFAATTMYSFATNARIHMAQKRYIGSSHEFPHCAHILKQDAYRLPNNLQTVQDITSSFLLMGLGFN